MFEVPVSSRRPGTGFAALAILLCIGSSVASAQFADVPPRDVYQERGRGQENKVALCLNGDAMMASFESALARELALALLLTPSVIEIKGWAPTEPLDYRLPLTFEEIYIQFAERCDGFMGFTLAQGYPDWMTITRPYLVTRTVLATTATNIHKLADIPVNRSLGTRILGGVDNQVIMYLQSLLGEESLAAPRLLQQQDTHRPPARWHRRCCLRLGACALPRHRRQARCRGPAYHSLAVRAL